MAKSKLKLGVRTRYFVRKAHEAYEGLIKKTEVYRRLEDELNSTKDENRSLDKQIEEQDGRLSILYEQRWELTSGKIYGQREISMLGQELDLTKAELETEKKAHLIYLKEARNLARQFALSRYEMKGLEVYSSGLERDLEREVNDRDIKIQTGVSALESELRLQHRKDTAQAFEFAAHLNDEMLATINDLRIGLESKDSTIELLRQKVSNARSLGAAYFLRLFGERLGIDKEINGVMLDSQFEPVYATSRFKQTFQVNDQDVYGLFSRFSGDEKEALVETARKGRDGPFCIKLDVEGEEHELSIHYRYRQDHHGNIDATFIEFNDENTGFRKRLMSGWNKRRGISALHQIFGVKPNLGPA